MAAWEAFFLTNPVWPGAVTMTWSDFAGFTDQAVTASITAQVDSGGGNPAPSMDFTSTTGNMTAVSEKWRGGSATWETWGVPAGAVVTNVQVTDYDARVWDGTGASAVTIKLRAVDATTGVSVHTAGDLTSAALSTVAGAWTAKGAGTSRAVDSAKQASTTAVKFELELTATTGGAASIDYGFDNIDLLITYAPVASGGGLALSQSLSDSVAGADVAVRAFGKRATDAVTGADVSVRSVVKAAVDTVTSADAARKTFRSARSDALSIVDSEQQFGHPATRVALAKGDTLAAADATAKRFVNAQTDALAVGEDFAPNLGGDRGGATVDEQTLEDFALVSLGIRLSLADGVGVSDSLTALWRGMVLQPDAGDAHLTIAAASPTSLTLTPVAEE